MGAGVNGATTNEYGQVYNETVPHGMIRCTSIKNVGGLNSMMVRLSATDAFGTVGTPAESAVLPGEIKVFTSLDVGLGISQPWATMELEVKSLVENMSTDYECHIANS